MNMFPSSPYMVSEVARQRHAELVREAEQWRLLKEVERARPRRRFSLRAAEQRFEGRFAGGRWARVPGRLAGRPAPLGKRTSTPR